MSQSTNIVILAYGLEGLLRPHNGAPELELLSRLLAKGQMLSQYRGGSYEALLFELFGYPAAIGDLPVGAVEWFAEWGDTQGRYILRADPVHLMPTNTHLMMLPPESVGLTMAEAQSLIDTLNDEYGSQGIHFEAAGPDRWYVSLRSPARINTTPLQQAAGGDLANSMPGGEDGKKWKVWMNDIQMVMHHAAVNLERASRKRLTANGIWFWGGGVLPTGLTANWTRIIADDPLSTGLATLCGSSTVSLGEGVEWALASPDEGDVLIVLPNPQENNGYIDGEWYQDLDSTARQWFIPLIDAVKTRQISGIKIITGSRNVSITCEQLRTGWRDWLGKFFRP